MDLFDHQRELLIDSEAPLAARMRPRTLDEFVGQSAIVYLSSTTRDRIFNLP